VLEQKVIGADARASYRRLVQHHGTPAPGPALGLMLPPPPARLATVPYWAFHPLGVERRRAETVIRACRLAHRLEVGSCDDAELQRRLLTVPGVGPWTVAEVSRVALGDADAVSVGDYHLPHQVAFAFLGERRGSDELMLELLEPFRPHRQRVIRLIESGAPSPPRRSPRLERSRIRRL
jgi:3-methyladenine DNA glycosylase/8-oxoguanine DNA glycosylase